MATPQGAPIKRERGSGGRNLKKGEKGASQVPLVMLKNAHFAAVRFQPLNALCVCIDHAN